MRTWQAHLLLASLSAGLGLAAPGCSSRSEALSNKRPPAQAAPAAPAAAPEVIRVEVKAAERHTFSGRVPITGELKPIREVSLKSRVGGNVVELKVDEGDRVKKGQLIARVEANNQRAQLEGAAASVELAEAQKARAVADLERLQRDQARIEGLYAKGAIDKKTLDDIRSNVRLAQVGVQSADAQIRQASASRSAARNSVAETVYRAPFDGVVSKRGVQLHEYLDTMKNREIVAIVDNSAMELQAAVAGDLGAGLEQGAKVEFEVSALPGRAITGAVFAVSPVMDPRTRTIKLRVRIPNGDGRLKGGMYATGFVQIGGERKGVGVPAHAVHHEDAEEGGEGKSVVWRVKDRAADKVAVVTGAQDGDVVEVLSGLSPGDLIVVSSPGQLKPGAVVTPKVL